MNVPVLLLAQHEHLANNWISDVLVDVIFLHHRTYKNPFVCHDLARVAILYQVPGQDWLWCGYYYDVQLMGCVNVILE